MKDKLIEYLLDKKIVILGFGIEGKSSYQFLRKNIPDMLITIACNQIDQEEKNEYLEKDENLEFIVGREYLKKIENFDLILKSPGISFKGIDTSKIMDKITSQLELFLKYCECYTIGITGTKGKSTTSSLIYQMLIEQGKNTILLGNIGIPIFDHMEEIQKDSIVILEISSHTLEYIKKSPNIGIILNIYEEHLDHYDNINKYIEAKFNILKHQTKEDIAIFNYDNLVMKQMRYPYKNTDYAISFDGEKSQEVINSIYRSQDKIFHNEEPIYETNQKRNLKGNHMLNDIMFVLAVSEVLKLDLEKTKETISNFKPLEHRMEFVGRYDDVDYYNDSIATIPESTINCVEALKRVNTLIVGGKDRQVELVKLIKYINESSIENIICMPKTGEYIFEGVKEKKNAICVKNMQEAVEYAKKVTKKGYICVLSPAASSYGYFKDFMDRGNQFKNLVKQ